MTKGSNDHGGDLDRAASLYGAGRWLDLSTGINPIPYPLPAFGSEVWSTLPTLSDIATLETAAASTYRTQAPVVSLAGAQAAIQIVPRLAKPGRAAVVGPTYNEHATALEVQGWHVDNVTSLTGGEGYDLVTVVNPNNPDGRKYAPEALLNTSDKVGMLVVDESFVDCTPELSLATALDTTSDNIVVLRSFGKFYGLAGLRLGFAISGTKTANAIRTLAGPWAVSGPAIAAGRQALSDTAWQAATRERLATEAAKLDALATKSSWPLIGGTSLFRTYQTPDAKAAHCSLAQSHIWSRIFPYSTGWIRLGLPGSPEDWAQLAKAMPTQTRQSTN